LIHPAAMLYGVQKMFGDQAKAKAKQAYGQLIDVHLLVPGVLGACLLRTNGAVTPNTPHPKNATRCLPSLWLA
jgi:hypothetical protein